MSRLENSVTRSDLYRLGKFLVDNFISSYSESPSVIILDCDDTNNDTYGQQELALFNTFYNEHCYMPLHIYEGFSGKLITTILRPGRRNKQAGISRLLQKLVSYLQHHWPKTRIIVRGDSHFASQDFMDWAWIQPNIGFIIGLAGNTKLHELAKVTIESAQREFNQYQKPVRRYHSFMYKAGTWKKHQRIIVKVEVTSMGTNIRYIVTNLNDYRTRDLYEKGYCARGAMELRIKDHKLYLKSDRSSCQKFTANQFRLFLHSMAYILMRIPASLKKVGEIKLGESGFSITCSEEHALELLRKEACSLNATIINIVEESRPDLLSSCYRCRAEFYINTDDNITYQSDEQYNSSNVYTRVSDDRIRNTFIAIGTIGLSCVFLFLTF